MKTKILTTIELLKERGDISFDSIGCDRFMDYNGTIEEVVIKLNDAFRMPRFFRDLEFFLYANRLLIGVIDYGLRTKENILGLKHSIEEMCLLAYQGKYKSCYNIFKSLELDLEILAFPAVEKKDKISWTAFDPSLSRTLIRKLKPRTTESYIPDYFILDGHDAYRPGLMIASTFPFARICAVRNAQDSKRDSYPRPLLNEEEYLRRALYNKDVLIIGEDVSTGNALDSLYEFVLKTSRPRNIFTAAPIFIPGDFLKIPLDYYAEQRTSFG